MDLKTEHELFRRALAQISVMTSCDGPNCHYCEGDVKHPLSPEARIARQALNHIP